MSAACCAHTPMQLWVRYSSSIVDLPILYVEFRIDLRTTMALACICHGSDEIRFTDSLRFTDPPCFPRAAAAGSDPPSDTHPHTCAAFIIRTAERIRSNLLV
jgi:hypothetical protein